MAKTLLHTLIVTTHHYLENRPEGGQQSTGEKFFNVYHAEPPEKKYIDETQRQKVEIFVDTETEVISQTVTPIA